MIGKHFDGGIKEKVLTDIESIGLGISGLNITSPKALGSLY
jgi:hypothetical protein